MKYHCVVEILVSDRVTSCSLAGKKIIYSTFVYTNLSYVIQCGVVIKVLEWELVDLSSNLPSVMKFIRLLWASHFLHRDVFMENMKKGRQKSNLNNNKLLWSEF